MKKEELKALAREYNKQVKEKGRMVAAEKNHFFKGKGIALRTFQKHNKDQETGISIDKKTGLYKIPGDPIEGQIEVQIPNDPERVATDQHEEKRTPGRPKEGNYIKTSFNIEADLMKKAKIKALQEGTTVGKVIRQLLNDWTKGNE